MQDRTLEREEKKVEYLELIYDLIFVYLIGRNNALLQHVEGGFLTWETFLAYVLCTLAVIQIWNFSTFYVNLYGRNGVRDHVFLFINMYLLYHMADGIRAGWEGSLYRFCAAWALILLNIAVQHLIEVRNHAAAPWEQWQLRWKAGIILIESALVGVHVFVYYRTGVSIAYVPVLFGIAAMLLSGRLNALMPVDFGHLTERAMLYVVFTFGEMIIAIAGYFSGGVSLNGIYFSLMAFGIVAGLFLSYEVLYNRIIDREKLTNGTGYMLLHVFLIFALNNLSVSLEFMREETVALLPKTLFLTGSFLLYFLFLFLLGRYARRRCCFHRRFVLRLGALGAAFLALMLLLRGQMMANIAVSAVFVYVVFWMLYRRGRASG